MALRSGGLSSASGRLYSLEKAAEVLSARSAALARVLLKRSNRSLRKSHKNFSGLRHWRSPCAKKPTVGFFDARNLRFSLVFYMIFAIQKTKIAAFSRKAKTSGVSIKCIFAFDSPPVAVDKYAFEITISKTNKADPSKASRKVIEQIFTKYIYKH